MANAELSDKEISQLLESTFMTSKKSVQEYVREIERRCRFQSAYRHLQNGTVLDDRSRLIDIYDACVQQDAHLRGVLETLFSQIVGERFMMAKQNEKGKYSKDIPATKKIQNTEFLKIIYGIAESKLYGYTGLEFLVDPTLEHNGLKVNFVERRNILADQRRIVQRQGIWMPQWNFDDPKYADHYVLVNNGDLGLFSAVAPLILAKKFTFANYVNFSHTYGQPIIHGKTESENTIDRKRMANDIASAAQNKVIVTGLNDEVDIKTFTMSNSEQVFTGLIAIVDKDVSNLILGSESIAGATQSYVGATRAHENIFRDRIEVYRDYIELVMNESIVPRLVRLGYLPDGLEFKYAKRIEMSDEDRIRLFQNLTASWEMDPETIEQEFGVKVKRQLNVMAEGAGGAPSGGGGGGYSNNTTRHLTDEEYFRRYGHARNTKNFLRERGQ
jgi:hypothetical protein